MYSLLYRPMMSKNKLLKVKSFNTLTLIFISLALTITSCTEQPKREKKEEKKVEKKNSNLIEIEGKVFSIPSPIQTAFLLKSSGAIYQSSLMNETQHNTKYVTTSSKALNLGIYGADLGYATIYDQSQDAISYMVTTKSISNELGITGIFNEAILKRFEQNLGNQDSLLVLVSDAFKSADMYLKNNEQNDLSVLILAGGWIETLHFATQLANSTDNDDIKNRIGEQKITIKNLINLMLPYNENQQVATIVNQLNELKDIYGEIGFSYEFKEPETDAESKITTIKSISKVDMTDEHLSLITEQVESIRNSIIN